MLAKQLTSEGFKKFKKPEIFGFGPNVLHHSSQVQHEAAAAELTASCCLGLYLRMSSLQHLH